MEWTWVNVLRSLPTREILYYLKWFFLLLNRILSLLGHLFPSLSLDVLYYFPLGSYNRRVVSTPLSDPGDEVIWRSRVCGPLGPGTGQNGYRLLHNMRDSLGRQTRSTPERNLGFLRQTKVDEGSRLPFETTRILSF